MINKIQATQPTNRNKTNKSKIPFGYDFHYSTFTENSVRGAFKAVRIFNPEMSGQQFRKTFMMRLKNKIEKTTAPLKGSIKIKLNRDLKFEAILTDSNNVTQRGLFAAEELFAADAKSRGWVVLNALKPKD